MGYCSSSIDFENVRSGNIEPSTYEIRHGKTVMFSAKSRGQITGTERNEGVQRGIRLRILTSRL